MTDCIRACALVIAALILCPAGSKADDTPQTRPRKETQTQSQSQTQPQTEVTTVNYEVLLQGTYSGLKDPLQKVILTEDEFKDLWKKHVSVIVPQPAAPKVDFSVSVIVAIYVGEKNTSGYQILLRKVEPKAKDVIVHYRFTEPPTNSLTLQVLTQPYMLIRIDKPEGQVQLLKE